MNDKPTQDPPDSPDAPTTDDSTRVLPVDNADNAATPATEPAAPKQRFADRLWGLKAMIAVALASVLLGGAGGAAINAVSHDDGRNGHDARFGPAGRFGPPGQLKHCGENGDKFGRGNGFKGPCQLGPGQHRRSEGNLPQPMPNGQLPATPKAPTTPTPSSAATS